MAVVGLMMLAVAGKSAGEVVEAAVEVVLGSASAFGIESDACLAAAQDVGLAAEKHHRYAG